MEFSKTQLHFHVTLIKQHYFYTPSISQPSVCVLGDDVTQEISDRDVGKHAVRGAVLSTHCACLMSWLFCLSPAGETHRSDRVQLFCHILCHGSTFHQSQSASACRSDGRNELQNSEAPICRRHRKCVGWIQSS